jgi:leucine-rich repeat protein SHOC2
MDVTGLPSEALAIIRQFSGDEDHLLMNKDKEAEVQSHFYGDIIYQISQHEGISITELIHRVFPLVDGSDFEYENIVIVKALFAKQVVALRSIGTQGEVAFQELLSGPKQMSLEKYSAIIEAQASAQEKEDTGLVEFFSMIPEINTILEGIEEINNEQNVSIKAQKIRDWMDSDAGRLVIAGITEIRLERKGISILPAEIGKFTNLQMLILHGNLLSSLPASIGNLEALGHLDLSRNSLTTVPATIGNLERLMTLDLSRNSLTTVPATIGDLEALEQLYLSNNSLTSVPASIGNLEALEQLYLSNNSLASVPASICNLVRLFYLGLSRNSLTSVPASICNLEALEHLDLSRNSITSVLVSIGNLERLMALDLSSNSLTSVPVSIGNLEQLRTLYLENNSLTSLPETMEYLSKLYKLKLNGNKLTVLNRGLWRLRDLDPDCLSGYQKESFLSEVNRKVQRVIVGIDNRS